MSAPKPDDDPLEWLKTFSGGVGFSDMRPRDAPLSKSLPVVPRVADSASPHVIPFMKQAFAQHRLPVLDVTNLKASLDWTKLREVAVGDDWRKTLRDHQKKAMHGALYGGRTMDDVDVDTLKFVARPIRTLALRARRTFCLILHRCSRPLKTDRPDELQHLLAHAVRLGWMIETVENFVHDFGLNDDDSATIELLEHRFREFSRKTAIRYKRTADDPLRNCAIRFHDELRRMDELEHELRAKLGPRRMVEDGPIAENFIVPPEQIIDAAFDAALMLEAHFEEKAFADADT